MNSNQIFIGNIKKCTEYERHTTFESSTYIDDECISVERFGYIKKDSEVYKTNAILIQTKHGGYVDLENLNSILDHIKLLKDITKDGYRLGGLIMSTNPHCKDCLFVDRHSLKPLYLQKEIKNISVKNLKKTLTHNN